VNITHIANPDTSNDHRSPYYLPLLVGKHVGYAYLNGPGNLDSLFALAWSAEHPSHPFPEENLAKFVQSLQATLGNTVDLQGLPHICGVAYTDDVTISHT